MVKINSAKQKRIKIVLVIVIVVLAVLLAVSLVYLNTGHYSAQFRAITILSYSQNLEANEGIYIITPQEPTDTALIFYPGAKVEAVAYLPLLEKITEQAGIITVLVEMPFNMAFFDINAATEIMQSMPEIEHFYIGGHSLGSAMASTYAEANSEELEGLIVLGGYVYGDYPPERSLTVYGTFNSELEEYITYTENIVIIEGGNHAQFGDYGRQAGDPDATISAEQQEDITVDAIYSFIYSRQE